MSLAKAEERAIQRDALIVKLIEDTDLPKPAAVLTQLRAYLIHQRDVCDHPGNHIEGELKMLKADGKSMLNFGPTIDRGDPTPGHFIFKSGARLSCGITLRQEGAAAQLVSYRFDYRLNEQSEHTVLRFDLIRDRHPSALKEPRVHVHLGTDKLRVPTMLISPFEVLDYLFYVVDPHFGQY